MALTADEIKRLLGLAPHPTCGFVAQTYHSPIQVPAAALPPEYGGPRSAGTTLYFLVTPDTHIVMHRIRSDQVYHHYLGDPLDVLLLYPDGTGRVATVGADLAAGERPQLLIPGGTFHMGRLRAGARYALLGTSEWIGVEPGDVERGDRERLLAAFPALRQEIARFMAQGG
ncbi:MAG TPA: cupin domain-containing protein [Chloroflexota bacterium]|nr:cupin domain-containing protein [Chloroflexota bacterium]